MAFHGLLANAAKNPVPSIMTTVLTDITAHFVRVLGEMPNEFVIGSRLRGLELLRARDGAGAAEEMQAYLSTSLRTYLQDAQLSASAVTGQTSGWPSRRGSPRSGKNPKV